MKKNFSLPEPRYIIDKSGKKTDVILNANVYQQLLDLIEDLALTQMAQDVMTSESKDEYNELDEIKTDLLSAEDNE